MTSNIGQDELTREAQRIGFDIDEKEEKNLEKDFEKAENNIKNSLNDYFSREFLNRIDKIIVFRPLDKKVISKIVELRLEEFGKMLLENKKIELIYDKKVISFIAREVYNPEYGAREIKRYITDKIEDKIAYDLIY
jgi:ATP-dependent Clp protease ATP-binding subunit ClpC